MIVNARLFIQLQVMFNLDFLQVFVFLVQQHVGVKLCELSGVGGNLTSGGFGGSERNPEVKSSKVVESQMIIA